MKNTAGRKVAERSCFSVRMNAQQTDDLWDDYLTCRSSPSEDRSPWEGKEILVQWDKDDSGSYQLQPLERPNADLNRFRQPIASAYKAALVCVVSGKPRDKAVIKLPALDGLEQRLSRVSLAYQQEYNLRDRFPPGQPKVLPTLMPDDRQPPLWESSHPYLEFAGKNAQPALERIPCVVREFIPGKSLGRWAREQGIRGPKQGQAEFHGLADPETWFELASALLKALAELHRERATHGFLYPENIILRQEAFQSKRLILDRNIVFTNGAESHRSVYLKEDTLSETARKFSVRRWYDSLENRYKFAEKESRWARFDLVEGSDYYSATDIFSLGVTLGYLATGKAEGMSPFDYVEAWEGGWQVIRGAEIRRKYHVMKAQLLDRLMAAAAERSRGASRAAAGESARASRLIRGREQQKALYEDSLRKAEVILQCIRSRPDRRALSANHALTMLEMFRPKSAEGGAKGEATTSISSKKLKRLDRAVFDRLIQLAQTVEDDPAAISDFVAKLLDHLRATLQSETAEEPIPLAIQNLVSHRMRSVLERITALAGAAGGAGGGDANRQPFLRVVGSRNTLIDAFLTAISSLEKGDQLIALTTTGIWNDENFGPSSRVSSMLQLLRLRGLTMRWLILVLTDDLLKLRTQRVLGFRCIDDRRMEELEVGLGGPGAPAKPEGAGGTGFYYACLDPQAYEQVLREKKTFIGFRRGNNPLYLHIAPDLSSRDGTLVALSFWMYPRRGKRLIEAFESNQRLAQPVINFERIC